MTDENTDPKVTDKTNTEGKGEPTETPLETPAETPAEAPEKKFSQADLDKHITDRLAREKSKREVAEQKIRDDAERKNLAENEKFKELADKNGEIASKLQVQLDEQRLDVTKAKKESMLTKAGYSDEQVTRFTKYLEGETDEELAEALKELKADVPPKKPYTDPSAGNGRKEEPKPKGADEAGKSLYQRLKEKGKVKGKE